MKLNLSGISTAVIVRSILTVILAVNIILGYLGMHLIPINEGNLTVFVNAGVVIATGIMWVWGFWKNNSFTLNAQIADQTLKELNEAE